MSDLEKVQQILLMQAAADDRNYIGDTLGAPTGAVSGAVLGTLLGTPGHMMGQHKMNKLDKTDPVMKTRKDVTGQVYRRDMPGNKVRPGARMAGGLVGALVGGGLGAGTAELVKRESPSARLLAKIQTQNGRLTSQDEAQLESLLTSTYSNLSDIRE